MNEESRVQKILRNSIWSVFGYVVPVIITIFVTPIIVFGLGDHGYGVYIFLLSIVGILGVLDLGFSTAVTRKITEHHSRRDMPGLKKTVESVNSIAYLMGIAGFLVCAVLGAGGHLLISGDITPHVTMFYVIVGLIFLVNSCGMVYNSTLIALQRFDLGTKIATSLTVITALASVATIKLGYGITGLLLIQLGLSISTVALSALCSYRIIPNGLTARFNWSKSEVLSLYHFGVRAFLANIGNVSTSYVGRLIIPIFLGPSALTYYSIPTGVATKIPGMTGALSSVLFPLTTSLSAANDTERVKVLYVRSFRLITILATAAASSAIFFAKPILGFWLGEEFVVRSTNILILLTLANFVLAIYTPLYNFLVGLGKLRMITIASFAMGGLNAILLPLLIPALDIDGVAWAYLLSMIPVAYMIRHTEKRYLQIGGRKSYYLKLSLKSALTVVASFLVAHFVWIPLTTSLLTLIITGPLSVLTYLLLYRAFNFYEPEDWRDLTSFMRGISKRIGR